MPIHLLSQELSNQIAAGEVIQNQAALIKELIENSLDARATKIVVSLEDYGLSKISIEDNGDGISKEELPLAPLRYATSKITSFEDLYAISTMGFRGEALASIFSVANVELTSKTKSQEYAYQITSENIVSGEYIPIKAPRENGTSVVVKNLFYNTPARLKYLRSKSYELREIVEVVKTICLIHTHLDCTLLHNSSVLFRKTQQQSLKENISQILQIRNQVELFEISKTNKTSIITGFILNPNSIDYSSKKYIFLYLNSRPVDSKIFHKAIMAGIGTNIHSGRFPMCLLNLIVDPQVVDVNIHPSKKEVKFELESEIFTLVKEAIEDIFNKENIMPRPLEYKEKQKELYGGQTSPTYLDVKRNTQIANGEGTVKLDLKHVDKEVQPNSQKTYFTTSKQYELDDLSYTGGSNETHALTEDLPNSLQNNTASTPYVHSPLTTKKEVLLPEETHGPLYEYLKDYKILGQLHKTYILLETPLGLIIIDQHVAEEKFYFEVFKEYFNSSLPLPKSAFQFLLSPKIIHISEEQSIAFKELKSYFERIGFDLELLREGEIMIRGVPLDLKGRPLPTSLVVDALDNISDLEELETGSSYEKYVLDHLSILSCKSSIRAGDELTYSEMRATVEKLKVLKEPFNCPHGRPIIVEFTTKDFEKMFKR